MSAPRLYKIEPYTVGLQEEYKKDKNEVQKEYPSSKGCKPGFTRATYILHKSQVLNIKSIAYWDRRSISEVVQEALEQYFKYHSSIQGTK